MISRAKAPSSDTGVLHIDWIVERETHVPSSAQFEVGIQLQSTSVLAISV
jgi:hypothetical protein